ncbi:MAG TPA: hypothetical protein VNN10_07885 [Dehalococcoidia bacterium]|nr:hypothetical protein [Dehalococcoidia bacterium]
MAQRVTSGTPFRRSAVLLNRDYSDSEKGAHRLKIEFDEGTGNDDCGRALAFLKSPGLDAARRNQIISTFVSIQGLGDRPEESDIEKLLGWVSERYEESSATWEMRDFLAPASTPEELLERAEGRHEAAHSGLLDEALTDFSRDWGHLTGEDTVEVEQESLERLRFMVTTATPAELEGMMALTGKTSLNELAAFEYGQYLERLQELRELKAAIAEGLSKAVELLAAAALTVATGGAASASMAVAIGAAIAGMFAREALLGREYELVSEENAKALIVAAASAGVGTAIGPAAEGLKAMERLGTARGFLAGALTEGAKAVTTETLSAALSDARLTEDAFADIVVRTVGNTLAGGVSGRMTLGLEDIPIRDRILPTLQAQAVSSMVSGTADEVAAFSGRGDMSAGQFIGRLGARFARSLGEATIGTLGEIGAASGGAGPEAEGGETSGPEETGASGGGGEGADGEAGAPAASETDTGTAPLPVEPVMAAEGVPAGTGDPAAAAEAALTTAHEEAPPGGGAGEPPDRLFPGLSEGEFDFTALGPLDTRPAPDRSERAEVVGDLDRTNPLGASGFIGSTAGATLGAGAFATEVRTERGDVVDAVVKVLPVDARDTFEREVAGAKAAATTGIGPPFYGVVEVEDGLAFAMGRVPGGFTENYSLEAPGSPGHEAAATEAAAALSALSAQAPRDVRNYASALVHLGYYYSGECQGLIGPDGRWRPIDFSGISPLPSDPAAREAALREHHSNIEHEASGLERDLRAR